jgi:L-alanine-DL-glutamate epimerase-like enolase superfamily enzyme
MYTAEQYRDLFETRSISIIQPDCSHVGGISHLLTIARMAEAYDVRCAFFNRNFHSRSAIEFTALFCLTRCHACDQ